MDLNAWLDELTTPPQTPLDSAARCYASSKPYKTGHAPWWVHSQLTMLIAARWMSHLHSCPTASRETRAARASGRKCLRSSALVQHFHKR